MHNLFFSMSDMGFYLQGEDMPSDAVEVSAPAETFLRLAIIWGASGFKFTRGQITVTYPEILQAYVTDNNAPFIFLVEEAS
ncbi:TPA: hypothetical protein PCB23_005762 [Klebsiella pneumoniae]|nr:hypothetical protein [Klebsiella pneumoniae]